jgi:hypothetical protein
MNRSAGLRRLLLRHALAFRTQATSNAAKGAALPVQADGDLAGLLPVVIEDAPGPIRVLLL